MSAVDAEAPVLTERRGQLGLITLNRPKAINSLTHPMVTLILEALETWRNDDQVETVAVIGSGERGLCAGGDIVGLYRDATEGDGTGSATFWADEYRMNAMIAAYPKPYVAIQDGIVLGGGIGVSAHGSHRIVTERSKLGFPEAGIGYIPDVGASWLLSRSPGELGTRIALSAEHVRAADAILLGLADAYVPSDRIPELLERLEEEPVDVIVDELADEPEPGKLAAARHWTDASLSADSVPEILTVLHNEGHLGVTEAAELAEQIEQKSPTALAVTLASLRRARSFTRLEQALETEYRVSLHCLNQPDFAEGIRAQVIDKDRNPQWRPEKHHHVTAQSVEAYFQSPPHGDLDLTAPISAKERA